MDFPRWLIDDTAAPGRVFCIHTQYPQLIGELLPDDDVPNDGDTLDAGDGNTLCKIEWLDEVIFEANDMCRSLQEALDAHRVVRGEGKIAEVK